MRPPGVFLVFFDELLGQFLKAPLRQLLLSVGIAYNLCDAGGHFNFYAALDLKIPAVDRNKQIIFISAVVLKEKDFLRGFFLLLGRSSLFGGCGLFGGCVLLGCSRLFEDYVLLGSCSFVLAINISFRAQRAKRPLSFYQLAFAVAEYAEQDSIRTMYSSTRRFATSVAFQPQDER